MAKSCHINSGILPEKEIIFILFKSLLFWGFLLLATKLSSHWFTLSASYSIRIKSKCFLLTLKALSGPDPSLAQLIRLRVQLHSPLLHILYILSLCQAWWLFAYLGDLALAIPLPGVHLAQVFTHKLQLPPSHPSDLSLTNSWEKTSLGT